MKGESCCGRRKGGKYCQIPTKEGGRVIWGRLYVFCFVLSVVSAYVVVLCLCLRTYSGSQHESVCERGHFY